MKTITNKLDRALPMPDGRSLGAKISMVVEDHVAGSDRIKGWSDAQVVLVSEHVERAPVPLVEDPKPAARRKVQEPDPHREIV